MPQGLGKAFLAEAVGTFTLIFIGAGSIIANQLTGGKVGIVGIALAHGLAIATMVATTTHISGGHFNPAVTWGFMVTRRLPINVGITYIVAQLVGASIGGLLLTAVYPEAARRAVSLGTPTLDPAVTAGVGIVVEAILTFLLVFVIFGAAADPRGPNAIAPLAIGLVITMDILAGGVLTGAAMNPARAFGPALFSSTWSNHLVYWVGPLLGGGLAAWTYQSLQVSRHKEDVR